MEEKKFKQALIIKQDMVLSQRVVDDVNTKIERLKEFAKKKYRCQIKIIPPDDTYCSIVVDCSYITEDLLKILLSELELEKKGCEEELKKLQKDFEPL